MTARFVLFCDCFCLKPMVKPKVPNRNGCESGESGTPPPSWVTCDGFRAIHQKNVNMSLKMIRHDFKTPYKRRHPWLRPFRATLSAQHAAAPGDCPRGSARKGAEHSRSSLGDDKKRHDIKIQNVISLQTFKGRWSFKSPTSKKIKNIKMT